MSTNRMPVRLCMSMSVDGVALGEATGRTPQEALRSIGDE